jgi:hypothetical protein
LENPRRAIGAGGAFAMVFRSPPGPNWSTKGERDMSKSSMQFSKTLFFFP